MGVVNYLAVKGEMISETRGGVDSDYIPDPLGSTAKLVTSGGTTTDTFSWWPYGEQRAHSGSSSTPFGYVGSLGYCADLWGGVHIRARELRPSLAQWQTVDPLWPAEAAYLYGRVSPVTRVDPTGEDATHPPCDPYRNPTHSQDFPIPIMIIAGPCRKPQDQVACNAACQETCASGGRGGSYSGSIGTIQTTQTTTGPKCQCSCTCYYKDCSLAQILFCMSLAKRFHYTYVGCIYRDSQWNSAANCEMK